MKRPTRHDLEQQVAILKGERDECQRNLRGASEKIMQTAQDIADLKQRLHAAETSNQFMRGYLARVQEDDVVREELVQTGEPGGEQMLIPKRKPASFPRPDDFTYPAHNDGFGGIYSEPERRRKARSWITY